MSRRGRGLLIALEGIDGAGKSTLARRLATHLRRQGVTVALWREPVDHDLGALAQRAASRDAWTGAMYFTLDRFLARPELERALRRHRVVVTDRSFYSTLAYQGSALSRRARQRLAELGPKASVVPDRIVLLDISPTAAMARLGRRRELRGPLERQRVMARVARRYRELAREGHWIVLDASQSVGTLTGSVVTALAPMLRRRSARR